MRIKRRQLSALEKGGCTGESSSKNLVTNITDMPYEILIMMLSLLPIQDAVATSSVCKNWKFLWCDLTRLNFEARDESLLTIKYKKFLYVSEQSKYIEQVNSVIRRYNHPVVHEFRIHFDLTNVKQKVIDEWLQFAVNKKVEILELDTENSDHIGAFLVNYEFPSTFSNGTVVELVCLRKLCLNNVKMRDGVLEEVLKRSPHLESISIDGSMHLTHIRIGGRCLNLKHLVIKFGFDLQYLHLSDFDLVSFTYMGRLIGLHHINLPKLKEVNVCQGELGLEKNVFSQISSCASSLQALSLTLYHPKKIAKLGSIPQLTHVNKLTLTMGAEDDDCLLEFASIAEAFPNLETFIVELLWFTPIKSNKRRKARHVDHDLLGNLKLFKMLGYSGRVSDLELVEYVIDHAIALKKVVIDPRRLDAYLMTPKKDLLERAPAQKNRNNEAT